VAVVGVDFGVVVTAVPPGVVVVVDGGAVVTDAAAGVAVDTPAFSWLLGVCSLAALCDGVAAIVVVVSTACDVDA
jgi:hypothetical protein